MFLFFRIPVKLLVIFFTLCVILAFLKAYQTYKKSHTTQPLNGSVQNSDLISQFNNTPENPDVLHHTTVILIAVAFPIFISPLLYLYYFKESTDNHLEDMNDEFHLFLADLLPNVGISIIFPVCIFARNPNLRRFTFQSIKDSLTCI